MTSKLSCIAVGHDLRGNEIALYQDARGNFVIESQEHKLTRSGYGGSRGRVL